VANIFRPDWVERDEAPLMGRTVRVGAQAGAERLGATLYEIDPGNNGSPFHLHHGNEEMIVVLAGRPTLRTLDGLRELLGGRQVRYGHVARRWHCDAASVRELHELQQEVPARCGETAGQRQGQAR
jgi:hypothetical protein